MSYFSSGYFTFITEKIVYLKPDLKYKKGDNWFGIENIVHFVLNYFSVLYSKIG